MVPLRQFGRESIPASAPEATCTPRLRETLHGKVWMVDTEFVSSNPAGFPCGTEVRSFLGSLVMNDVAIGEVSLGSFCPCGLVGTSEVAEQLVRASKSSCLFTESGCPCRSQSGMCDVPEPCGSCSVN